MKKFIKYLLGNITIYILKFINLFIEIRFSHLCTSRIGHQITNFDICLCSISKKTFVLFSYDEDIANNYLFKNFKKTKQVFFSRFFRYFHNSILSVNPNSNLIISWETYQPKFTKHLSLESKVNLPKIDELELESFFEKYNLKNFIGINARNNLYVSKLKNQDDNFHDFRNFEFEDFDKSINFLKNKNYQIVKLGQTFLEENYKFKDNEILTSMDFKDNKKFDFLLNKYSKYNICGNSGLTAISSVLRKSIIYINFIPFNLDNLSYCSPGSIVLPKKIFSYDKNRFLNFREMNKLNFSIHNKIDPYKENKLKVINNTPDEILNAVIEMENKFKDHSSFYSKNKNFQKNFWDAFENKEQDKVKFLENKLKILISSSFLEQNQELL